MGSDQAANTAFILGYRTRTLEKKRTALGAAMQLKDLPWDVTVQIMHHYVSMTDDGAFVLMLICSSWSQLIVTYPNLWSYILIDTLLEEWEQRVEMSLALSRQAPITITVRLPFRTHKSLSPDVVNRISMIIFETYTYQYHESHAEALRFLKASGAHYQGDIRWRTRERAPYFVPAQLVNLESIASGPHPKAELSTALINDLSLQAPRHNSQARCSIRSILSLLPNLVRLQLHSGYLLDEDTELPTHITLNNLRYLVLNMGKIAVDTRMARVVPFVSSLHAPSLVYTTLEGMIPEVLHALNWLHNGLSSESMILKVLDTPNYRLSFRSKLDLAIIKRFPHLIHLDIDIGSYTMPNCDIFLDEMAQFVQHFTPILSSCRLIMDGKFQSYTRALSSFTRAVDLVYNHAPEEFLLAGCPPGFEGIKVDSLTLFSPTFKRTIPAITEKPVRCRKLRLVVTDFKHALLPNFWPQDLEEFEWEITSFMFIPPKIFVQGDLSFPYLTKISCAIEPATLLVRLISTPALETITIKTTSSRYHQRIKFEELAKTLGQNACPRLNTLAVEYFPPWKCFFELMNCLHRNRGSMVGFTVKLPAFPHPSIMRYLVDVLKGVNGPPLMDNTLTRGTQVRADRFYHHCLGGGWSSCSSIPCRRVVNDGMAEITVDTCWS